MRRASSKMGWLLAAAARWLDERSLGAFARRRAIPHNALSRAPASAQTATVLMRALTEPIPTSSKAMASSRVATSRLRRRYSLTTARSASSASPRRIAFCRKNEASKRSRRRRAPPDAGRRDSTSDIGRLPVCRLELCYCLNLRAFADRRCRRTSTRLPPERQGNGQGIDRGRPPPCRLVADPVKFLMVQATDRHRELVADLAPEGAGLGKTQVVGINGRAPADEAGLVGDEFAVVLVAESNGLDRKG